MSAPSPPSSQQAAAVEQAVDVLIIGAGLTGLASAAALAAAVPRLRVAVLEARPPPNEAAYIGGACRVQANGLAAAAAIDPRLRDALLQRSALAGEVLLHDIDAGTVITRLQPALLAAEGAAAAAATDAAAPHAAPPASARRGLASPRPGGRGTPPPPPADLVVGWGELEQLLLEQLPPGCVEWGAAATELREDAGRVRVAVGGAGAGVISAAVVVAADGALSAIAGACCSPGARPEFQGTVRWTGRLPGDLLATVPSELEGWWLSLAAAGAGAGAAFNCAPLPGGDVAWQALAGAGALAARGLAFDAAGGRVVEAAESPSGGGGGGGGGGGTRAEGGKRVGGGAGVTHAAGREAAGAVDSQQQATPWALLQRAFEGFPTPVKHMIANTPPGAVVEIPAYSRRRTLLPESLGRGRIAIIGEAAHPVPPTGLEASIALEDAAELAAAVQEWGPTREALRRFELRRRPRWRHLMGVSAALAASPAGSVSLHAAVLDLAGDLQSVELRALRRPRGAAAAAALSLARVAAAGLGAWVAVRLGGGLRAGGGAGAAAAAAGAVAPLRRALVRVVSAAGGRRGGRAAAGAGAGAGAAGGAGGLHAAQVVPEQPQTGGPLRRLGRAVGNAALGAAAWAGRPLAGLARERAADGARKAVASKLGMF
ncbi:hypothetical protein Rsub_12439 [Raphidocelis subcapitata]|uniref:FAD-binding domain-containing protein n=1 Tax=Raphidocelis subcapitata TaxID=307507 RepID=A0A2V0PJ40_9CHLO|nr:hypothetical protein Rsub_12439 [Raphidocelis subcapitata]|eukprot:GBF99726.1 hypothetical protein Rsub_12439 [Raphidocelis subcapitata]